jgi:hypothetical protein
MNVTNPEIFNLSAVTTYNVDFTNMTKTLIISGANTSVNVVGTTGTANEYTLIDVIYLGSITGAGTLQIFGASIPSQLLGVKFKATAMYYSGAWTIISLGSVDTAFVSNANVITNAAIELTKLANLTAERIPQINSAGKIEASSTNISFLALLGAITVSASQINNVGATTSTTADLNVIAGSAAAGITPTIISFLAGATSNIQSQINAITAAGGVLDTRIIVITNGVAFKAPGNVAQTLETNDYMLTFEGDSWGFTVYE